VNMVINLHFLKAGNLLIIELLLGPHNGFESRVSSIPHSV
jgi:hypothetical protein